MKNREKINVAVVDDDASLCKALSRLLDAWNMNATTYPSAEAFLEDASRPAFDCLVLDIQLSGMSGFDLQDRLRGAGRAVPVVFITSHEAVETRDRALTSGAGYVRKSEPGVKLRDAIVRLVGREA